MRKVNKYKIYNKVDPVSKFPIRILKFKRPKWHKLQDMLLNTKNLGSELIDITAIKNDFKVWNKVRRSYKERLKNYSFLSAIFDNSIRVKKLKTKFSIKVRKNILLTYFYKNYYKTCNLLWFANFFASSFESRQKVASRSIFVNDQLAAVNSLLDKGDIISVVDDTIKIDKILKKYSPTNIFLTHIEVDYYSQNIILVKDFNNLSEEDFFLLSSDYINIQNLR
jgi:hypothetical protein